MTPEAAQKVQDEVRAAVAGWREVALSPEVGLTQKCMIPFVRWSYWMPVSSRSACRLARVTKTESYVG